MIALHEGFVGLTVEANDTREIGILSPNFPKSLTAPYSLATLELEVAAISIEQILNIRANVRS